MNSAATHIVTRCEWNTSFDSKNMATTLQTYISKWSTYKMQRIIDSVFDRICPEGQTLKIKKLAIDLGAITYENMERELPIRLKNALYEALYSLIMYPKSGDQTLEIINSDNAQLQVLKTFLLEGILPWNYHESYGSASHIMNSQLTHNRLEIIQLIQKIGIQLEVRKRIVWQFNETIIKKVITGLEPNNHQQIISFSEEFVKIQEKENVLKTSTQSFKKNLWLWILNYLFVDRGTIFNKIAFVRSTIVQIANHFNISYEILVELIETAIQRHKGHSSINNDFIVILKLLSEELYQTSIKAVKTEKQQENFWNKIGVYFNSASARTNSVQKNEFNELVINLSKLDAKRFQKIILKVEQKSQYWETILKDLIPAAVENLFVALSPSESKNILTQIEFLTSLDSNIVTKVKPVTLYALGIEFCVQHQNSSVSKHAFLAFVIEKVAKKQQQSKVTIIDHFLGNSITKTTKKTAFIPLFNELKGLFQQEVTAAKVVTSEKIDIVVKNYIEAITKGKHTASEIEILEKKMLQWIAVSPKKFWNAVITLSKDTIVSTHIAVLIASYGTLPFLKEVHPKTATVLEKVQSILNEIRSRNPKHTTTLRAIQYVITDASFSILWSAQPKNIASFFSKLLCYIQQEKTVGQRSDFEETMQLIWKHPHIKTLGFSVQELANIQQQYKVFIAKTPLALLLETTQEANQQEKAATLLREIVRSKKIQQPTYQKHTEIFITYLLSNGIQLRNDLISTFLEKITKQTSNKTTTEIQVILEAVFWQTLVLYTFHKGNSKKFSTLFETTLLQTFSKVQFQKPVAKTANLKVQEISEASLATILEAAEKINQQEKVATLLREIVRAKKIQHSSYQKHTKTFIQYLLSNGIQIRKKLFTKFLKQFAATETTLTTTQIEEILDICFWESITLYKIHKGNEQQFSALFETTITQKITSVKKQEKKSISSVENHFETIEIPIKITATTLFEIIEKMLVSGDSTYSLGKKTYTFSEVFLLGLETSPKRLRTIIQETVQTKQQVSQLQNILSFQEFISLISKDTSRSYSELYQSIQVLFVLAKQFGNTQVIASLKTFFWKETIQVIQSKSATEKQLKTFVHKTFEELSNVSGLDLLTIVKNIQQHRILIPTILKNTLIAHHAFFEAIAATEVNILLSKAIENCISEGKIEALSSYLVTQFSIPAWFQHTKAYTYETVLEILIIEQPLLVLKTIRSTKVSAVQLAKISQTIRFSTLVHVLVKLYPLQQKRLVDLQKLYESMAMISVTGISTKALQDILSKKVWKAWQTSNWELLSNTHIWNELLWEICGKQNVKQHDFINAIQTIKTSLPSALQLAFTSQFPQQKKAMQVSETIQTKKIKSTVMPIKKTSLPDQGIAIPNAGLVLLNNYFLMLLDRLGIIADNEFKTPEDQLNAVHYFQYIVTGLTETEESLLVLNKILSGLSPDTPVKGSIEMTEDQKQLIDGLIKAAIGYWSSIGETSINGFRGNWLVREGILRETEDRWELIVEKRAYDILLMKSPFSFSIIKLPWMEKPLHVTWPY